MNITKTTKSFEEFKISRLKQIIDYHANNVLNDTSNDYTILNQKSENNQVKFSIKNNYSSNKILNPKLDLSHQLYYTTKRIELLTSNMTFMERLYNFLNFS